MLRRKGAQNQAPPILRTQQKLRGLVHKKISPWSYLLPTISFPNLKAEQAPPRGVWGLGAQLPLNNVSEGMLIT